MAPRDKTYRNNTRLDSVKIKSQTQKNPALIRVRGFRFDAWRCPTLTWGDPTLPSALSGFTSEFGMGSGGSHLLLSLSKLLTWTK